MKSKTLHKTTTKPVVRPIISNSTILKLHEKHRASHFLIKNDKELFDVALVILKARYTTGYHYYEPEKPESLDYTLNDIERMPKSLADHARSLYLNRKNEFRLYEDEIEDYKLMEVAIAASDGKKAWEFLRSRENHQYERVELIKIDDLKDY